MKHYIKKVSQISAFGSMAVLAAIALSGCEQKPKEQSGIAEAAKQGQFMVIQEVGEGKYKVVEQYPANGPSRAILKDMNGTERLLSEDELKKLANEEAKKVENNTSNLTKENSAQMHGGGMSLGETILASAAGALIGGYIANKLFNNPNFQANQRVMNPTHMSQPTTRTTTGANPQSGYFKQSPAQAPATPGGSPTSSTSSSSYGS